MYRIVVASTVAIAGHPSRDMNKMLIKMYLTLESRIEEKWRFSPGTVTRQI